MRSDTSFNCGLGDAATFAHPDMRTASDTAIVLVLEEIRRFRSELRRQTQSSPNERALTEVLVLHLNGCQKNSGQSFVFQSESMENRSCGNSPAVDIGVFWKLPGRSSREWPRVSAIEAKRLDSSMPTERRQEYVIGHQEKDRHVPCGGMERYKNGIHGSDLKRAAMLLGYVQTDDFPTWWHRINGWIADLAKETAHVPPWAESEQLGNLEAKGGVAVSESALHRAADTLGIVHLWVDLIDCCVRK